MAAATFAASALPSGFEAAGLAVSALSAFSAGGGGIVMSICCTLPSDDRGLSNSFVLPTTSTAS